MRKIALFALFLFTLSAVFTTTSSFAQNNWRDKVDAWVLETAVPATTPSAQNKTYPTTQFLVKLHAQADLSGAAALATKAEKGRYVYEQLTAVASQTQPAVIQQLEELGVAYKPFWVSNMIWVEGDIYVIQTLAMRSDVAHLYANPLVKQDIEPPVARPLGSEAVAALDNIQLVGAADVWALGYTGQGVVIGGQDTGYEWTHDSLQPNYRGWNGSSADHNYNWHDAWNTAVGACPANSQAPCDDYGHGTHTMGTMAGINDIGMAPGAKWIGCRNMTGGDGTPASYTACYQWFMAPTDLNNANPDPTKAPDVINNSWSCPTSEGCVTPDALAAVVANVRAAGIVTVHSAGNSGSACSTINTPAAIYDDSFTVGATNSSDVIAGFSSRGPVTWDGSNRLKPDITAPGVSIYSSTLGNGYGLSSGTSMAAPHVAGLVALLISARPYLRGHVDAIEQIIRDTAVPLTTAQNCGSDTPTSVPNNVYGYGRIDAFNAVTQLILTEHLYLPLIQKN